MNDDCDARYVSPERIQMLSNILKHNRKTLLGIIIGELRRQDNSNAFWYMLTQEQRNTYMDKWINAPKKNRTPFCNCRKINIIQCWINNMKI